jgi:hypothetical protein
MFGWEFPPVISGGLGVACHAIVQGLLTEGVDIVLVLPFSPEKMSLQEKHLQYIHALDPLEGNGKLHIELVEGSLRPYLTSNLNTADKKKREIFYTVIICGMRFNVMQNKQLPLQIQCPMM